MPYSSLSGTAFVTRCDDVLSGAVVTLDAVPVTLCEVPIAPNGGGAVTITIVCRDNVSGDVAYQTRTGLVRHDGVNVVLVGAMVTLAQAGNASLAGVAVSYDGQGGIARVRVTGLAGRTLVWCGQVSTLILAP